MIDSLKKYFWTISKAWGIEWAPLNVPLERRLQTATLVFWMCFILMGEAICIYLYIKLLYSSLWWLALLYAVWMINDIEAYQNGGRRFEWARNLRIWRYYCDYFPIKVVKTAELDPTKNYLFACYPHGVVSLGVIGAFATNASSFNKLFKGMTAYVIILSGHFLVPIFREIAFALGGCGASSQSLLHLLNKNKYQGNCVALMTGGAAEALNAHPDQYKIILNRRKGFIRVVMKAGAGLVPVISFGENNLFRPMDNPQNGLLRKFQEKFRGVTSIAPMFPIGRGIFQYSFGILPLRHPVHVVIGAPIEVERNLDPTDEEVEAVHAIFTQKLVQLFESEKSKYLKNHENVHVVIT